MEPTIDERILDWILRAESSCTSNQGPPISFDIGKRIQFLTVDIITQICLGTALGCVASDSDKHEFLETVERGNKICQHLSVLLELNSLIYYLTMIPLLGPLIVSKPTDSQGVGRIMGVGFLLLRLQWKRELIFIQITRRAVEERAGVGASDNGGMINSLLKRGVPESQVDSELVIAL